MCIRDRSAAVRVNGNIVFLHTEVGRCDHSATVTVPLHKGENRCEILLLNVHLHCTNSFSLLADSEIQAIPPLLPEIEDRANLEVQISSFYLAKTLLYPGEIPEICTDLTVSLPWPLRWELICTSEKDATSVSPRAIGDLLYRDGTWIAQNIPSNLASGSYSLKIFCVLPSGSVLSGPSLSFLTVHFFPQAPQNADYV